MILQVFLLSGVFTLIFILLHFAFLYLFSFEKLVQQMIVPFFLSNIMCFYFLKDTATTQLFYNSFIINLTILIIYAQFVNIAKKGFTLSIITTFKNNSKLRFNDLVKSYANGRGAKWILIDRLNVLKKLKVINLTKKITLNRIGILLSAILILLRKILGVRDFG